MRTNAKPLPRDVARIELKQWLAQNSVEQQVFCATDRIAEAADMLVGDLVLTDVLAEVENLTGITDPLDPISMACCAVMLESMNLSTGELDTRLQQVNRERNQHRLNNLIIASIKLVGNEGSNIAEVVTEAIAENNLPVPSNEHLLRSIDNVINQMGMADAVRTRLSR